MLRERMNAWFFSKAQTALGGKEAWECVRDMQLACRVLVPVRAGTIRNEEGNLCTTLDARQQWWRRHFTHVLNIISELQSWTK